MLPAVAVLFLSGAPAAPLPQAGGASTPPVRPIGVVTEVQPGRLTLHTDGGQDLIVQLPGGIPILRVPPGAKDLKSATPIIAGEINAGDRILVRGALSEDQKTMTATTIIVMTRRALAEAHVQESHEWQTHGISGVVKAIEPATKEITLAVPNSPPTPANPTHPVQIALAPSAVLLRYAPDSVKFSDAQPSSFDAIKVGDQARALGSMSAGGARFTAQKLVSGTFRNIGATVISVDAAAGTIEVKDLANKKPLLVRTNADSMLHTLPPLLAMMIARFNSGGAPGHAGMQGRTQNAASTQRFRGQGAERAGERGGREGGRMMGRGPGGGFGGPPRDFNQMLARTPPLSLSDLKPGEALIIVSTEGAKPTEVTAIAVLAGVEPILEARPKGSKQVQLGPWNMSTGGSSEEGLSP